MSRTRRRGNALVELTLLMPLLVSLFLGVWQFGYTYHIYNELEQAVRAGARYASLRTYDSFDATPSAGFLGAVRKVVVYGDPNPAAGSQPVVPGLTTDNVSLTVTMAGGAPAFMTVAIANYQVPGAFSRVTLNGHPSCQFPFLGIFGP